MKKCVFLDRDGNINVEKDYLHKVEDFEFEKGALEAIEIFKELGYIIIVVTNQSGIARGYYSEKDLELLNEYMIKEIEKNNGRVDDVYFCPHHPEKGIGEYKKDCLCRKPNTGMLLKGIEKHHIDPEKSIMVGDKLSDVEAGRRIGARPILVRTGHGRDEEPKLSENDEVYDSLYDFALKLKEESVIESGK